MFISSKEKIVLPELVYSHLDQKKVDMATNLGGATDFSVPALRINSLFVFHFPQEKLYQY